jgi:hypothetical protein
MPGVIKGAYVIGKVAGKAAAKATVAHPQWIVYKTGVIVAHTVVTGVKVVVGIAGGLLMGHFFFGE